MGDDIGFTLKNKGIFVELETAVKQVDIDSIFVNPYQPRRHFDPEELEELASSIRSIGLLQPPLVRPGKAENTYELIAGERRLRAAKRAGLTTLSVVVRDAGEDYTAEAALIENIQRVDLNPLEIARALQELKSFGLTQEEIAERLGKKRSTVANYLRLLDLSPGIQEKIEKGLLTMGHAKALLAIDDPLLQEKLCQEILEGELSVRELESRTKERVKKSSLQDIHLGAVAEQLQRTLGTKVTIQGSGRGGKICIDYYSVDDLQRLLELITHE